MRHNPYFLGRSLRTATTNEFYCAQLKSDARFTRAAVQHDIRSQMCARYSLTKEQITMLIGEIEVVINIGARYNIAATQIVPAIRRTARGD
jgi:hypothetical protein